MLFFSTLDIFTNFHKFFFFFFLNKLMLKCTGAKNEETLGWSRKPGRAGLGGRSEAQAGRTRWRMAGSASGA